MAQCKFIHVEAGTDCLENFSGTGRKVMVVPNATLATAAFAYDEDKNKFTASSEASIAGYLIEIADGTGQVTSESNADGGGFNITGTFRVSKAMDDFATLARTLNNLSDYGVFISTGKTNEWYAIYDPERQIAFSNSFDSGNTLDSEHGHTATFVVNGCKYPVVKYTGAITKVAAA